MTRARLYLRAWRVSRHRRRLDDAELVLWARGLIGGQR